MGDRYVATKRHDPGFLHPYWVVFDSQTGLPLRVKGKGRDRDTIRVRRWTEGVRAQKVCDLLNRELMEEL